MSDLEEMGYIIQPHTRQDGFPPIWVIGFTSNQLMKEKEQEVTEMKELMIQRQDKMELVLKQMAKVLAAKYQLRHHDYLASVSPDEAEIHPAVGDQRRSAAGGCGSGRQCGEEQKSFPSATAWTMRRS